MRLLVFGAFSHQLLIFQCLVSSLCIFALEFAGVASKVQDS